MVTEQQQMDLFLAMQAGALYEYAVYKRGYAGDITIPAKEKAKRRMRNKMAKQSRKRNRH